MATFENINGFQLFRKHIGSRNNGTSDGPPYIKIIKSKNSLPYVELVSRVLYWQPNMNNPPNNITSSNQQFFMRQKIEDPSENFVWQYGFMYGFPLFDVLGKANWTTYNNFNMGGTGYEGWTDTQARFDEPAGTYRNFRPPLVEMIDASKNLIVLDYQNLDTSGAIFNGSGQKDFDELDLKYLVLRVKYGNEDTNVSDIITVNQYWNVQPVIYTFICDIVNPHAWLDFNTNILRLRPPFAYSSSPNPSTDLQPYPYWIKGTQPSSSQPTQSGGYPNGNMVVYMTLYPKLKQNNWIETGGDYQTAWGKFRLCVDNGSDSGTNASFDTETPAAADMPKYPNTLAGTGWSDTIALSQSGTDSFTGSYTFKDLLWYSLRSPRLIDVSLNTQWLSGEPQHKVAYVQNIEDVSGGYAKDINTTEMSRNLKEPYFSSTTDNPYNPDTNDVFSGGSPDIQYASSTNDGEIWTGADVYQDIYFKLLVPPENTKEFSIEYTFGQDAPSTLVDSSGVVTFERKSAFYNTLDKANYGEGGTLVYNNIMLTEQEKAMRLEEKIKLIWDDTLDSSGNMPVRKIRLIDIASGSSKQTPEINSTDTNTNLYLYSKVNPENYDISANVVQIRLRDASYNPLPGESDYNQNDAMNQIFNELIGQSRYIVDIVPLNYKPFRFLGNMDNKNSNLNGFAEFDTSPDSVSADQLYLSPWKVISDQSEPNIPAEFLKISYDYPLEYTGDLSYNVLVPLTGGETNSFPLVASGQGGDQDNKPIFLGNIRSDSAPSTDNLTVGLKHSKTSSSDIFGRPPPVTLEQGNNFIPDYWQWSKKMYDLDVIFPPVLPSDISYNVMRNQIKVAGIIDIINIKIDVQVVLLNTAYNETYQTNIPYPLSNVNDNITNKITIVGGGNVNPSIDVSGVVLDISLSNPPTGDIPDETLWTGGTAFPKSGTINNNGVPVVGGDVVDDITLYSFFGAYETYPTRITDNSRRRWNDIYYMSITGANPSSNPNPAECNLNYRGLITTPSTIIVNCVELPPLVQSNKGSMLNDANTLITITWPRHYFAVEQGKTLWTVNRIDTQTLESKTILSNGTIPVTGDVYRFTDNSIRIYDKYYYKVSGTFEWTPDGYTNKLSMPIGSFATETVIICINNQFPYGRYNTTSTNLKLYRPLLMRDARGQCSEVDEFGNTSGNCVGGLCLGLVNGKMQNLYNPGRAVGGTRNIYANTSDQMSQKQVYVLLAKSTTRPFR